MCECCDNARARPEYRGWTMNCPFCVARGIQTIQRQSDPPQERSKRCKWALGMALMHGLDEQQIRTLVKKAERPLAPPPDIKIK